jgi:hypothetical protein
MNIEYETSRIFALDQLGLCKPEDFIDWGLLALQNGSNSTEVAILAGLNPQNSYFEVREDFILALNEIGIGFLTGGEAIDNYLEQASARIIEGSIPYKEILKVVYALYLGREGWDSKYDTSSLLSLYWAIDDLQAGQESWSYYYRDLNTLDPAKTVSMECQIMLGRIPREESRKADERLPFRWEEEPGWFGRAKEMLSWLFTWKN